MWQLDVEKDLQNILSMFGFECNTCLALKEFFRAVGFVVRIARRLDYRQYNIAIN